MEAKVSDASGRGKCFICDDFIPTGQKQVTLTKGSGRWARTRRFCVTHGEPLVAQMVREMMGQYKTLTGKDFGK